MEPKEDKHDANQDEKSEIHKSTKKGVSHMATIQKWGNSLAVRIPNQFAKNLGVTHGSEIELQLLDEEMRVKPIKKSKPTLDELLARAKGKLNPHLDYDFGRPEGKELI